MTSAACCATVETASASQGRSLSWRRCATVVISPQTNPRRPTPIPDPKVMDWLRSGDIWQPDLAATEAEVVIGHSFGGKVPQPELSESTNNFQFII